MRSDSDTDISPSVRTFLRLCRRCGTFAVLFFPFGIVVVLFLVLYGVVLSTASTRPSEFGEMFGGADALFSALGFAGLIVTLLVTTEVSNRQSKETSENIVRQTEITRADLFERLRSRYLAIHAELPGRFAMSEHWRPKPSTNEWRAVERYWYNAFDEWYITTRLLRHDQQNLWTTFFERAIASGINLDGFRFVLCAMVRNGASFGGLRDEFLNDLVAALQKHRRSSGPSPTLLHALEFDIEDEVEMLMRRQGHVAGQDAVLSNAPPSAVADALDTKPEASRPEPAIPSAAP